MFRAPDSSIMFGQHIEADAEGYNLGQKLNDSLNHASMVSCDCFNCPTEAVTDFGMSRDS